MDILLEKAPPWLPSFILELNLIRAFFWYVAILFLISLFLRLRFYLTIYNITRYIAEQCPNVFRLVHEHWFLCVRDRFLQLVILYGGILVTYWLVSRLIWPTASVSVLDLAEWHPWALLGNLFLIGTMVTIDIVLVGQTSVIDQQRIIQDLKYAEGWLGGRLYRVLNVLGRFNLIKNVADNMTAQTMVWFNVLFRGSMRSMIAQTAVRVIVGCSLFASHAIIENIAPAGPESLVSPILETLGAE